MLGDDENTDENTDENGTDDPTDDGAEILDGDERAGPEPGAVPPAD